MVLILNHPGLRRTLEELDRQLGRLVEKVRQVGALESTTFVLTGDHGMTSWNQSLLPAVLAQLTEAGFTPEIVTPGQGPALSCDVVIVPNSVRTGAFSLRGAADTPGARDRLVATLEAMPQIDRVIGPDELPALHASSDEGDVIAEAAVPFGFGQSPPPGQWRGSHGSLAERHVPLLLAGAGVRPGTVPHRPRLVDLAPTITTLLGVEAPRQSQGRPLREVLQHPWS
jgi:arylsulfatase A-like enzyme